jgi:hypothetical protein
MWPTEEVVKVVFGRVVLGQAPKVAILHFDEVLYTCFSDTYHDEDIAFIKKSDYLKS